MRLKWQQGIILVLMAVLSTGLVAACGSEPLTAASASSPASRAVTVRVAPATSGSIRVTTAYAAIVEAKDLVDVVPLGSGMIQSMTVDVGSEVRKGEVIAELSHGPLDAQLQQAEAVLRRSRAELALAQAKIEPNAAKARAELDAAQVVLDQLLDPSAYDLQIAQSAVFKARSNVDSARTTLDQLLNPAAADLLAAEALVAKRLNELSAAQAKVNQGILAETNVSAGGGLAGEWGMVLIARRGIEADTATLFHPALSRTVSPSVSVDARESLMANQQVVANLLSRISSDFIIPEGIRSAMWAEAEARTALETAQAQLDELLTPNQHDIDLAQQDINQAQAELDAALTRVDLLKNPNPEVIADAESKVEVARQTLALSGEPYTRHDIDAARSRVDEAQSRVDLIEQQLSELKVLAPFDGVVTRRLLTTGAMASSQKPVVTVAGKDILIALRVEETNVASLQQGQRVTLTSPALPGLDLELEIYRVAPAGDEKAHTFLFYLRPVETTPRLMPGMSGRVSVVTRHDDAVLVPKEGVLQQDGQATVFVVQDGTARSRRVEIGLVDSKNMEILSGIQPGDLVMVSGRGLVNDGDQVTIEERSGTERSRN